MTVLFYPDLINHTVTAALARVAVTVTAGDGAGGGVHLADLTAQSGQALQKVILGICGTALIVLVAVKALKAYAEDKYGKLASLVIAGGLVAFFVYFPDDAIALLKSLGSSANSGT